MVCVESFKDVDFQSMTWLIQNFLRGTTYKNNRNVTSLLLIGVFSLSLCSKHSKRMSAQQFWKAAVTSGANLNPGWMVKQMSIQNQFSLEYLSQVKHYYYVFFSLVILSHFLFRSSPFLVAKESEVRQGTQYWDPLFLSSLNRLGRIGIFAFSIMKLSLIVLFKYCFVRYYSWQGRWDCPLSNINEQRASSISLVELCAKCSSLSLLQILKCFDCKDSSSIFDAF